MTEIDRWIAKGAGVQEGLRLLAKYRPNPYLARMVEKDPARYASLLRRTLTGEHRPSVEENPAAAAPPVRIRGTFREEWPFLDRDDCPAELKILAADMITSWRTFAREHEKLYLCTSPELCLDVAKKCIKSYCQNRRIHSEFAFYKNSGQILGKHPIFAESRRLEELRQSSVLDLERKRRNLRDSIWRLRRLMKSGDNPAMDAARQDLLSLKEQQLEEVEKMIADYEIAYGQRKGTL